MQIESRKSEKVKQYCRLVSSKKARQQAHCFPLEGLRLCMDALQSGYAIEQLFVTQHAFQKSTADVEALQTAAKQSFFVSDDVADKMADTVTTQGVFCVVQSKVQKATPELVKGARYVALDCVQNPANLGAIARTAEALGLQGLIIQDGCDMYNPKAQRAAMGSLLRIEVQQTEDLAALLKAAPKEMLTFSTVPDATAKDIRTLDCSGGAVAVIGNEGNGVSAAVLEATRERVTIPMQGRAESLNAAVAATITMWEMMR